ncbi:MAG: hypothetical protein MUC92_00075 [Fimbriimonadaceae bacterium]|jgi:hypothetical protein|nr:hypothetical protein [Fimbriimonadaceae bacterium]
MKKLFACISVLALACLSFAPIEDRPTGAKFHGELSEQQLQQMQGSSDATVAPASGVQIQPEKLETEVKQEESKAQGEKAVAQKADPTASAASTVAQVGKELESKDKPSTWPVILGAFVLTLGIMGAFAFKVYANKVVPEPRRYRKPKP